jgi:hypothetical protein
MTNQFPDATKMVLSPAAQAIASAYDDTPEKKTGNHRYLWLAAALRAAADQVEPDDGIPAEVQRVLDKLLAIADELDDVKYGTYRSALSDKPK